MGRAASGVRAGSRRGNGLGGRATWLPGDEAQRLQGAEARDLRTVAQDGDRQGAAPSVACAARNETLTAVRTVFELARTALAVLLQQWPDLRISWQLAGPGAEQIGEVRDELSDSPLVGHLGGVEEFHPEQLFADGVHRHYRHRVEPEVVHEGGGGPAWRG